LKEIKKEEKRIRTKKEGNGKKTEKKSGKNGKKIEQNFKSRDSLRACKTKKKSL